MHDGNRDGLTPRDRPFVLLAASARPADVETALRHMGLQPEPVDGEPETFRLRLGSLQVVMARAGTDRTSAADPQARSTSVLGAALDSRWRDGCWIVRPEGEARGEALYRLAHMLVLLIDLLGAAHLFWSPARLWSDAAAFRQAVAEMEASGMPPVLHLIAFRRRDTAGSAAVATRGLAAFAGQEVEAEIPQGWDMAAMVRRLARVALDIMLHGPIRQAQQAPGLEAGEWVAMTPRPGSEGAPGAVRVAFRRDG